MKKEEIVQKVGKPILMPIGIIQGLFIIMFISSPFVWIWHSWELAWKLTLTGAVGFFIAFAVYSMFKSAIIEKIDEEIEKQTSELPKSDKSLFQQKIEKMQKEAQSKN